MPPQQILVPRRALRFAEELLRGHLSELGDLVLGEERAQVAHLHVELPHLLAHLPPARALPIQLKRRILLPRVQIPPNHQIRRPSRTLQLNLDIPGGTLMLHVMFQFGGAPQDLGIEVKTDGEGAGDGGFSGAVGAYDHVEVWAGAELDEVVG